MRHGRDMGDEGSSRGHIWGEEGSCLEHAKSEERKFMGNGGRVSNQTKASTPHL